MATAVLDYQVDVPEGKSGDWYIERFSVSEEQSRFDSIRSMFSGGGGGRYCRPGSYTRLVNGYTTVMSDTNDEIQDHREPIRRATGICLVNGLGLGVVANGMLLKDEVERVDVVELSEDVISLVGPHYESRYGDRINIIHADAMTWRPSRGTRYSVVWHDIWPGICSDNLKQMKVLHRAYGRRTDWQGSWCRKECERHARSGGLY